MARTFEYMEDSIRAAGANALVEGADASSITITQPTMRNNTCQIIGETFAVAGTVEAIKTHGRAKETAYQLAKTLKALKLDVEYAMVGVDNALAAGSAAVAREMASATQMITTALDAGTNATDPLTEAKLIALHQTCYENGSEPTLLMIKPADAILVSDFATATGRNRDIDNTTLVAAIDVILTPFGEVRTVINRSLLSTHALLIDPAMWKQCVLRPFTRTLLAQTGDAMTHQVLGEVSLKHSNYGSCGMITGLS